MQIHNIKTNRSQILKTTECQTHFCSDTLLPFESTTLRFYENIFLLNIKLIKLTCKKELRAKTAW